MLFEFLNIIVENKEIFLGQNKITIEFFMNIVRHILFYPTGALWYIQASIIGALLLGLVIKYLNKKISIILALVLYCFALLCNNYYFVTKKYRNELYC